MGRGEGRKRKGKEKPQKTALFTKFSNLVVPVKEMGKKGKGATISVKQCLARIK